MSSFHDQQGDPGKSDSNVYDIHASGLTAKGDPRQYVKHNYTDHSHEQGDPNFANRYNLVCYDNDTSEEGEGGTPTKEEPTTQILQSPTFPLKLHMILEKIEKSNSSMKKAISWLPHGRAFHIRNGEIFKREVLPKYFRNCKMSSFYRQINLYGFVRLTTGCETGAYYHEYFLRGRSFLTKNIVRTKVKGTKIRPTSAPEDEPNFYGMTPVGAMQQMEMPLNTLVDRAQSENSYALLAAMQRMGGMNYNNAENQNYRYNAPQVTPQNPALNTFMGGIANQQVSPVSVPQSLSLFDRGGYFADNLRSPYEEMSRSVNHDMTRTALLQNELSRAAAQTERSRAAAQTERSRAAVQNEMSRVAMHNELSRNVHTEMPRIGHHNEIPQGIHNEFQRTVPSPAQVTANSLDQYRVEELKMIAKMLRQSNRRAQSNMSAYSNPNHM